MISMKLHLSKPKIAILRAIGLPEKKWNDTFLLDNALRTVISCVLGTGLVYAFRLLISSKYKEALESFGYPENDLFGASAEVYKQVNDLNSVYLFEYEIHNARIVLVLIVLSLLLITLSVVVSCILLHTNKSASIISLMNARAKE